MNIQQLANSLEAISYELKMSHLHLEALAPALQRLDYDFSDKEHDYSDAQSNIQNHADASKIELSGSINILDQLIDYIKSSELYHKDKEDSYL